MNEHTRIKIDAETNGTDLRTTYKYGQLIYDKGSG